VDDPVTGTTGLGEPLVVGLREAAACDVALTGAKAATLARLLQAGFPVPDGFVLTVPALSSLCGDDPDPDRHPQLPHRLREAVRGFVEGRDGQRWAVRSSAVTEDSPEASFAGQYDSLLDVEGLPALETAVFACWASARNSRVAEYGRHRGVLDRRIAVLVQRYVDADLAGVALGADPLTGDRETVVVTAVRGVGAGLVGGLTAADEWEVLGGRARCRRPAEPVLTAADARTVTDLLRRLESGLALPQDLEWAMSQGELSVLQLRPMTGLAETVEWRSPLAGGWLRGIRLGEWLPEPVTPLCHTWLLDRMEEEFRRCQQVAGGFRAPAPTHVLIHGWYFHSPIGAGSQALLLAGLLRRPRLALATVLGRRRPEWSERLMHQRPARQWWDDILPRYRSAIEQAERRVGGAEPADLLEIVDRIARLAGECYWSLVLSGGAAWRAEDALARFHRRHLADRVAEPYQVLVQGLSSKPPPPHAVHSLDWVRPTLGEMPSDPAADGDEGRRHRSVRERVAAEAACRDALAGWPRIRQRFDRLLDVVQRATVLRRAHTDWFTAGWPIMRRALLRLGEAMCVAGLLEEPADVFLLTRAEVERAARDDEPGDLRTLVIRRRQLWELQRRLAPPATVGTLPLLLSTLLLPADVGARRANEDSTLRGVAAGRGRATGPVRILRSPTAAASVRAGDVLVVSAAVPALTPVFGRIGALCVDIGSVAAHAAVVAREYGIPVVMGLTDATTRLSEGQLVTVDGTAGVVELW
jgi:pyruvate,water dikinase